MMTQASEAIKGTVKTISRPFNGGWRFASVPPHGTVTGNLPSELQPGDVCIFKGAWKNHPKYGRQFEASQCHVDIPKDVQGIQDYLDRHFKWVGPIVARRMVEEFGTSLFRVMEHDWMRLTNIQGMTEKRAEEVHKEFISIKDDQQLDIFFATHGITLGLRNKLVDHFGDKSRAVLAIKADPYQLSDDIFGVGFLTADRIALSMGIKKDSSFRLRAGLRYILKEASEGEGHCYLSAKELLQRSSEILQCGASIIQQAIEAHICNGLLVDIESHIYHPDIYRAEMQVAEKLRGLALSHHSQIMNELTRQEISELDLDQRRALELSLSSKILVITGGPGTGKTHLVKHIIKALGSRKIELCAPTGKAAKRMSEMSGGKPARTIHRLLEYSPLKGGFQRNRDNPLECDTLIVDETSMIDIYLMSNLLDALTDRHQIIFVGDVDQLPSVGPGRCLKDMIDSELIPTSRLRTLHRVEAQSMININAQRVNLGKGLDLSVVEKKDFWFYPEEDQHQIPSIVEKVCRAIPGEFGFSYDDVQVLCPQKKGVIGAKDLNERLRPVLNQEGQKLKGTAYYSGDRVIQLKNDYDLGIFNGEIGHVSDSTHDSLIINFEDLNENKAVEYPLSKLNNLQLAYALTIHKSQGSEFKVVVIPIHTTNYMMLKRNLLYTAITRGKELVILIGSKKAVNIAIRTIDSGIRFTNLKRFIQQETIDQITEVS